VKLKRTIEILKLNIIKLMNEKDLSFPFIDRMQIREECEITGRFMRLIINGEREPGLAKLDAMADLFAVPTHSLIETKETKIVGENQNTKLDMLISNYSNSTTEGKEAIEHVGRIVPKHGQRTR
tara:strand:- start:92 stop:463 length:372 start_codon:yes stop_codon:yes gene_type:complete